MKVGFGTYDTEGTGAGQQRRFIPARNAMNPIHAMGRAGLPIAATVGLGLSIAAAVETTLPGWGDYRFGMTPEQIRALPDTSWSNLKSLPDGSIHYMTALTPTRIEGHDFHAGVYFNADKKLKSISFIELLTSSPSSECERRFQDLLRTFETHYGSFSPQLRPEDAIKPNTIEWRSLPGSTSQYYVLTVSTHSVIGGHGDIGFIAAAWREFGLAWVKVQLQTDGEDSCALRLTFQKD